MGIELDVQGVLIRSRYLLKYWFLLGRRCFAKIYSWLVFECVLSGEKGDRGVLWLGIEGSGYGVLIKKSL